MQDAVWLECVPNILLLRRQFRCCANPWLDQEDAKNPSAGLTQEELARRLKTKKTAISRIENHAEDIKLSTLEKVAHALGKRLEVKIA